MGIAHVLSGQFAKSLAYERVRKIVLWLFVFAAVSLTALGFVAGWTVRHAGGLVTLGWVVAAELVIFLLMCYAFRRVEPYLDALAKDRVKRLRGGQAEAFVAATLAKYLPDDWNVFNGVQSESARDNGHVVVGPSGVFCVSTLSRRGGLSGSRTA